MLQGGILPLRLTAAKSRVGHAEPAAGSIGAMQALAQLTMKTSVALIGLRALNPYVTSVVNELETAGKLTPYMPRQGAAAVVHPSQGSDEAVMAVSSFAFQGTNSHMVLANTGGQLQASTTGLHPGLWQRQRFWYTSPSRQLLQRARVDAGIVTMQSSLSRASLAFLNDHKIQGKTLFPAAAMLEMLLSSAMATQQEQPAAQQVLHGISISAPLIVPTATSSAIISCSLAYATGGLEMISITKSGREVPHLAGQAGLSSAVCGKSRAAGSLQQRMFDAFLKEAAAVLRAVVPKLVSHAAGSPPMSTGQLAAAAVLSGSQTGGFLMHPAVLDSMTHTAAVLQASTSSEAGQTRIPVGMDGIVGPSDDVTARNLDPWCSGLLNGLTEEGSALASFSLAGLNARAVQLFGFQAKVRWMREVKGS